MSKNNISISDYPIFNKNERQLISHLLYLSQKNKIAELTLEDQEICSLTKIHKDDLSKFIYNLTSKIIEFKIMTNSDTFHIHTNCFSYLINNNLYLFIISPVLFNAICGDDFFSQFKIQYFLRLKLKKSYKLYNVLINSEQNNLELQIDQLKLLLNESQKNYLRFFDFESKVLAPIINDINQNTPIFINYHKIRNGRFIDSIQFEIESDNNKKEINKYFFSFFEYNFIDTETIINRLQFLADFYSQEELKTFFASLKRSIKKDKDYEKNILNNLTITNIKNVLKDKIIFNKKFDTPLKLLQFLSDEISKLDFSIKLDQNFYPPEFLMHIYTGVLKEYHFENEYLTVDVDYKNDGDSTIILKAH